MKGELQPKGYLQCCKLYMDMLTTKKLVALFDTYKTAHDDVMMELIGTTYRDQAEPLQLTINHFCEMVDMQDWFNELGK